MQKYKTKPFALIGINSDPKVRLKQLLIDREVTWKCIWDGGSPGGPIASAWRVHSWPSMFLIDKKGIIRVSSFMEEPETFIDKYLAEK